VRAALLIVGKDLRLLRRSPALLAALLVYPLVVALLVGLVVRYAGEEPRVAFVDEDGLPAELELGGSVFDVNALIDRVVTDMELVRLGSEEAGRALAAGDVLATITVPDGFVRQLRSMASEPKLELRYNRDLLGSRILAKVQALVYNLNREVQETFIREDLVYVDLLRNGGRGQFAGQPFDVLGLRPAGEQIDAIGDRHPDLVPEVAELQEFVEDATLALGAVESSLRATANPVGLETAAGGSRDALLSSQVQAYALALALALVAVLLAAGAVAVERDENVMGRLTRGLVSLAELVVAKVLLVAVVGGAIAVALALAFGVVVEATSSLGGHPWLRVPVLVVGAVVGAASLGAFGVFVGGLARDARAATLVAFLAVLPVVLLGLVPRGSVPPAAWISEAFPFVHTARLVEASLGGASPAWDVLREVGSLVGLGLGYGALARLGVRRLAT
jgi:ABC-2 type transport system permease protein